MCCYSELVVEYLRGPGFSETQGTCICHFKDTPVISHTYTDLSSVLYLSTSYHYSYTHTHKVKSTYHNITLHSSDLE